MIKKLLFSFLKGILAGLSIGLGGFLFILVTTYLQDEAGKILGALVFPIGLFLICTFNLHLFTGKIGLVFEKKQEKEFYFSLLIMYIGNILGTLALGYLCFAIFKDTDLFIRATAVAESRINFDNIGAYFACLIKAMLCGMFVYFAVKAFAFDPLRPIGITLMVLSIAAFVYLGLEHCIANSFYFSFANKWTGCSFLDLTLVTIGNAIGTLPAVYLLKLAQKQINKSE